MRPVSPARPLRTRWRYGDGDGDGHDGGAIDRDVLIRLRNRLRLYCRGARIVQPADMESQLETMIRDMNTI